MIGLGSNRLSVCRRGGMRVTQAGRGGMEWLAGFRAPSWATPYSAQATAALKAQFPTQWPTIRDYGFAHPALVPFINEDPMMVMSLIEGLGTRWLISDGNNWIDTGIIADSTTDIYIKFKLSELGNTYCYAVSYTDYTSGSRAYGLGLWDNYYYVNFSSYSQLNKKGVIGEVVEYTQNGGNYVLDYGSGRITGSKSGTFTCPDTMIVPGMDRNGNKTGLGARGANINRYRIRKGSVTKEFVPFVSSTRNGMLDIHDLEHPTFYPNQGTGTFTTSETPAS